MLVRVWIRLFSFHARCRDPPHMKIMISSWVETDCGIVRVEQLLIVFWIEIIICLHFAIFPRLFYDENLEYLDSETNFQIFLGDITWNPLPLLWIFMETPKCNPSLKSWIYLITTKAWNNFATFVETFLFPRSIHFELFCRRHWRICAENFTVTVATFPTFSNRYICMFVAEWEIFLDYNKIQSDAG